MRMRTRRRRRTGDPAFTGHPAQEGSRDAYPGHASVLRLTHTTAGRCRLDCRCTYETRWVCAPHPGYPWHRVSHACLGLSSQSPSGICNHAGLFSRVLCLCFCCTLLSDTQITRQLQPKGVCCSGEDVQVSRTREHGAPRTHGHHVRANDPHRGGRPCPEIFEPLIAQAKGFMGRPAIWADWTDMHK